MSRARSILRPLRELLWRLIDMWPYMTFAIFIVVCFVIWILGHPTEALLWLWGSIKYTFTP